jgi:hypothetical protein
LTTEPEKVGFPITALSFIFEIETETVCDFTRDAKSVALITTT